MEVSVVIPAYNEAGRIAGTLAAVAGFFKGSGGSWEVIVVDDGSSVDTEAVVSGWLNSAEAQGEGFKIRVISIPHQGKGAAAARGVQAAEGRWVLLTDADLSTPITEWPKLREALQNGAAVAAGSRQVRGARVEKYQPLLRQALGVLFGLAVRAVFPVGVVDTQCGFKGFAAEAARELFHELRTRGYCFDVEIFLRARARGFKVTEVPVIWRNHPDSRVRLWKDLPQVARELRVIRREMKQGFSGHTSRRG